ncbi:MFS transporter [Pseudonocardia sp.]|uniref:MFS transporter n=1 Tax=Pseudonocardia sp. TaxID=60912 RepID=UPI0031FD38A2
MSCPRSGTHPSDRGLFRISGMPTLLFSSFIGNFALWGALFIGVQSLNASGASVLAVQCTAIASFAPLLLAGTLAGRLAERLDRLGALRVLVVLLASGMAALALATALDAPVAVVYVAALLGGLGQIGNLTLLRPVLYELAGPHRGPTGLAMDALGSSLAVCLGPLVMGFLMTVGGATGGYAVITVLFLASRTALAWVSVPPQPVDKAPLPAPTPRMSRRLPYGLSGILGITIVVNLFYFPFQAIIPVVGERFTTVPSLLGVLAAGPGLGMVAGNTVIALLRPRRLGAIYLVGSVLCLLSMVVAVHAPLFGLAFIVLVVAGLGVSGFSGSQATLVLQASPDGQRSRTMGLLSTAIGVMPIGTLLMGVASTTVGIVAAVTISGAVGVGTLVLCLPMCRPFLRGTHVHRPAEVPDAAPRATRSRSFADTPPASDSPGPTAPCPAD